MCLKIFFYLLELLFILKGLLVLWISGINLRQAWAYYTRAIIHKNLGDKEKAGQDIEKCLEYTTDPKLVEAARALMGML
jgi:hypothetical protein